MHAFMRRLRTAAQSAGAKPRVLLVDDHRPILDAVAAMLGGNFDVVGLASDGRQAIDMASQVAPDVIVLDVNMPHLDGFQTARALQQAGLPPTPVVFLSVYDQDDHISEAFRCGGRGYVVKSRIGRDLMAALDQVLLGRLFVPSIASLVQRDTSGGHAVLLHDEGESSLDGLARFFDHALRRGDATCLIAPKEAREAVRARLRARGWDVGESSAHNRYSAIDAADALNRFMRDGLPDADRLAEIATELDQYRRAVATGRPPRLTIFGNMAALLIAGGNTTAAGALETMWDSLTRDLPFLTVCAYTPSCFHDDSSDLWSGMCTRHFAVSHAGYV
jgi:DNA-binding NarL/FixJ family response regulator